MTTQSKLIRLIGRNSITLEQTGMDRAKALTALSAFVEGGYDTKSVNWARWRLTREGLSILDKEQDMMRTQMKKRLIDE